MKFTTNLYTDGKGFWSSEKKTVKTTGIDVPYISNDGTLGELCVYFDTATWDTSKDGLIYTDQTFLSQLKDELALAGFDPIDVSYSEQGMQGNNYVSLDVGEHFLNSFKDLVEV